MSTSYVMFDHAGGNKVKLDAACFQGRMPYMIAVAMMEAPDLVDDTMVITSAHRDAIEGERFSYHHVGRAVDIRTGLVEHGSLEFLVYLSRTGSIRAASPGHCLRAAVQWTDRIRSRCGNEFDWIYGDDRHIGHIHGEHDAKKEARVFG